MDQKTANEWLCYFLRVEADTTEARNLKSLSTPDWDDIIQRSIKHKVSPLLYHRLKSRYSDEDIPDNVVPGLRDICLHSIARNVRLYHGLSKVLKGLKNDGIPVIVLKGAHLAEAVYNNIALRPMTDIDLLIKKADLSRAGEKLLGLGYVQSGNSCVTQSHLAAYTKPGGVRIEIHPVIEIPTSPFKIDVDGLWERARPAMIAGVKVMVLSPEDLMLHLCIHASFHHHFTMGLRPFCDISEILRYYRNEIDWAQVQSRARQWGAGKCVYLTLYIAGDLLDAAVPDTVLNALKPDDLDPEIIMRVREQIFTDQAMDANVCIASPLARMWGADRLRDKVTVCLKNAFLSPRALAKLYPVSPFSKWIYFYYPLRLKYLLRQHGRTAWRLLRRDKKITTSAEQQSKRNDLADWLTSS